MNNSLRIIFSLAAALMLINPANAQNSGSYEDVSILLVEEGNAAIAAEDYSVAMIKFEQALVANPQNITGYIGLGNLYFAVKSYPLSLKYYDIALSLDPTSMHVLELSAYAHLATDSRGSVDEIRQKMETICILGSCEELDRLNKALEVEEASTEDETSNS